MHLSRVRLSSAAVWALAAACVYSAVDPLRVLVGASPEPRLHVNGCGRAVVGRNAPEYAWNPRSYGAEWQGAGSHTPEVETVATGLEIPWSIAFAPDGRIFLTERPGRVRVIERGKLREKPWAELQVALGEDSGLRGLALAPNFGATRHVFVLGSFARPDGVLESRIYRFTDRGGSGTERTLIADGLPANGVHRGGALAFGPDGMLYVTTGDVQEISESPAPPQDAASLAGKILRYLPDGGIPADNPWPSSPVYALGVRNPQGLAWHPATGTLFATEHGPTDFPGERGHEGEDEVNAIVAGGNYGWPVVSGREGGGPYLPPLAEWTPAIAPSGVAVYTGRDFPWYGDLFVGALRGQQLRRIVLQRTTASPAGWRIVREEALFAGALGRIRAVAMGPDGHLYFTTSNRSEPNASGPQDDRLLRLVRRQ